MPNETIHYERPESRVAPYFRCILLDNGAPTNIQCSSDYDIIFKKMNAVRDTFGNA